MFEIICVILFFWFFIKAAELIFSVAWGAAKLTPSLLLFIAVPVLVGCLLFAGGLVLLLPVILIAVSAGILRTCV